MADLVLVAVIVAFTGLCVAYISWCDRIIGPDVFEVPALLDDSSDDAEQVAA